MATPDQKLPLSLSALQVDTCIMLVWQHQKRRGTPINKTVNDQSSLQTYLTTSLCLLAPCVCVEARETNRVVCPPILPLEHNDFPAAAWFDTYTVTSGYTIPNKKRCQTYHGVA